jgi:IS5 family transposase
LHLKNKFSYTFEKMIKYTSQHQLKISEFKTPFEQSLLPTNRWVILADVLPWDKMAAVYHRKMSSKMGRLSLDTRLIIGVLIFKHYLKLDDREVLATLQENVYLQYFVGFTSFQTKIAFDPSLLVTLRKRMGMSDFDEWTLEIISQIEKIEAQANSSVENVDNNKDETPKLPPVLALEDEKKVSSQEQIQPPISVANTLIIDTTAAEQKIKYPTDLDLLNKVRILTEGYIDALHKAFPSGDKPRTYRNIARKSYLNAALKKKKSRQEVRKAIKKQLGYIDRNMQNINRLWDVLLLNNIQIPLSKLEFKKWLVCQEIYRQQLQMLVQNVKSCEHRIVSIDQPHVRAIPRGKAGKSIEFGAKIALSVVNGTNRIHKISWDAYNDGIDLIGQVEAYKKQYNKYPKLVLADKIYMTRANRDYLKKLNIEHRGEPLGRRKKDKHGNNKPIYNSVQIKEGNQRNHVEGQFGTAKDAYGLNRVRAKTQATSESMIANTFFVMNIVVLLKMATKVMIKNLLAHFENRFFRFSRLFFSFFTNFKSSKFCHKSQT